MVSDYFDVDEAAEVELLGSELCHAGGSEVSEAGMIENKTVGFLEGLCHVILALVWSFTFSSILRKSTTRHRQDSVRPEIMSCVD